MHSGIKNPFVKPKQKFKASTGKDPLNTEFTGGTKGDIRLDGGSHVIVLKNTDLEDIPARLGALFAAIQEQHQSSLAGQHGIALSPQQPTSPDWQAYRRLSNTHVALPTPQGSLFICADEEDEDEAFRRMGRALQNLPVHSILQQQKIQLIVRP